MPRIAVVGSSCVGKSTFIEDFIKQWPNYKRADRSYRDLIKSKKLKLNQQGNQRSQEIILNSLMDEVMKYDKSENIIHDRIPLDNYVYTLWLKAKNNKALTDEFVENTSSQIRIGMKFIDLIFYIPILDKYPVTIEERDSRDLDLTYREEIDNIYRVIHKTHVEKKSLVFDFKDKDGVPPMFEIFGDRQMRIDIAKLYLDETGDFYGDDQSLLTGGIEGFDPELIKKIEATKYK